jgi:glycosyltransferase involved in cell wall biosynthesis
MKFCFWGDIHSALVGKTTGGGELQVALIAEGLADLGHDVTIIDFNIEDDMMNGTVKLLSLRKRTRSKLAKYVVFYSILLNVNADYYYARIRTGIHYFAYLAARRNKSIFIIGIAHDLDTLGLKDRFTKYYSKLSIMKLIKKFLHCEILYNHILRKSNLILAQHQNQKKNLLKMGLDSYVCTNIFSGKVLQSYEKKTSDSPYIFLGALDKRKGIDNLVLIISKLPEKKFIIVGRCRDEYASQKINAIKNKKNVEFVGQLSRAKVLCLLKKGQGLVSTSLQEGFPNSFLEAWANGIPVFSLHVDPGGVISKFNLGYFSNSDISDLISQLKNHKYNDFIPKVFIDYINKTHSRTQILNRFVGILKNHDGLL